MISFREFLAIARWLILCLGAALAILVLAAAAWLIWRICTDQLMLDAASQQGDPLIIRDP